ncbi:MAG: toll/interleukin-1 receptor domain-containing protein, partial [Burkholderiales bacterium]
MDVFVAYSNKDEPRVRTIVQWLRLQGIEVWVAYERPAGLDWDKEIDNVLAAIPCVLAVWSPDSVDSPEVKGEARAAMARNALVTVSLDRELPPRSFTHLHAIDLSGLTVDEKSPRTAQVLEGIRSKLSSRPNAGESSEGIP